MITIDEARNFVNNAQWTFAKSYSKTFPHSYSKRNGNDQDFENFIYYLRENSKIKKFQNKQYLYLELDGFEYWEMGRPLKAVLVLNRAPIDDSKDYRYPWPDENDKITLLAKLKTRDTYLQSLLDESNLSILQKKQIDFLMNTTRRIEGGGKNIIDHSKLPIRYE